MKHVFFGLVGLASLAPSAAPASVSASAVPRVICHASFNGNTIRLTSAIEGRFLIDVDDPRFERLDVMIDATRVPLVKARLAFFTPPETFEPIRKAAEAAPESVRAEILKLTEPRIVDAEANLAANRSAIFRLSQGEDFLYVICVEPERAPGT